MTTNPIKVRRVPAGRPFMQTTAFPPPIVLKEPAVRWSMRARLAAIVTVVGAICGAGAWVAGRVW